MGQAGILTDDDVVGQIGDRAITDTHRILAEQLISASGADRLALLRAAPGDQRALAYALKHMCADAWTSDPGRAAGAAAALADLASQAQDTEIDALAAWTAGIVAITDGAMEAAIRQLDAAENGFRQIAQQHLAAETQVSKLIALGMLGRYDEAAQAGMQARDIFLAVGDELAAAKIEQNLGTIALRRDRYHEAEQLHRLAIQRFEAVGAIDLLVAAENALAADLFPQLRLREAAQHYQRALTLAQTAGLERRQAEVEVNLGGLAVAEGRYDQALALLERARRRYTVLGLRHEAAYVEHELADAYLHLNMAAEAAAIYARVIPTFAELGMRAEQALSLAYHGRAATLLGRHDEAEHVFEQARMLFAAEDNPVNAALVDLFEAQHAYERGAYEDAAAAAHEAELVFAAAGSHGRALLARWLRGEATRALGQPAQARPILEQALRDAEQRRLPQLAQRCHSALGLIALAEGDLSAAERSLQRAVTMIEAMRAPIPADDLRTSFIADKLTPYTALVQLCLDSTPPRIAEAFDYAERARSRALAEIFNRSVQTLIAPHDPFEAQIAEQLTALRAELNWLYRRLSASSADHQLADADIESIDRLIQERETQWIDLTRQLQLRGGDVPGAVERFDLAALQESLGDESVLVAYYTLDSELIAFVIADHTIHAVRGLDSEANVSDLVERLRFQIEAMQRNASIGDRHYDQLIRRVRHYLHHLYRVLLAPLEGLIGRRRLVVVPHRTLHYVPFHALYDGTQYLIEAREVCTAPSAAVLQRCLMRERRAYRRALLAGVPDARAPRVQDEITALAALFPEQTTLLGPAATSDALRRHAPSAEVLHLACHGVFRPDNPLLSALQLADGRFTAGDAYGLNLQCNLVVLSACETGVNRIAPGDELLGLARGFFAAGAPALLVSLWPVDDNLTATLMGNFYQRLLAGDTAAHALRAAQRAMLATQPHPFFWAPFVLMGRW